MQYQIEIDPSALVHDGVQYEPVAFRSPKEGERFVEMRNLITASVDYRLGSNYLIVRPVWQWPEHLGGAAIAMDADGDVFWYESPPSKYNGSFANNGGGCLSVRLATAFFPSFTPPPLKPGEIVWNPKYKPANESE